MPPAAEGPSTGIRNRSVTADADDAAVVLGVAHGERRPLFFAPPPSSEPGASVGEAIHEAFVIDGSPAQVFVVGRLGSLVGTILGIGIGIGLIADGTTAGNGFAVVAAICGVVAGQVLLRKSTIPMWALDVMLVFCNVVIAVGGVHSTPLRTMLPAIYTALGTGVFLIRRLRALAAPPRDRRRGVRLRPLAGSGRAGAVHPLARRHRDGADLRHVPPVAGRARHVAGHHRARRPARGGAVHRRARARERGQERVPRPDVPRAPHAAQRGGRASPTCCATASSARSPGASRATSTTSPAPAATSCSSSTSCST